MLGFGVRRQWLSPYNKRVCKSNNYGKKQHLSNLCEIDRICANFAKFVGNKRMCLRKFARNLRPPCYGTFCSCQILAAYWATRPRSQFFPRLQTAQCQRPTLSLLAFGPTEATPPTCSIRLRPARAAVLACECGSAALAKPIEYLRLHSDTKRPAT